MKWNPLVAVLAFFAVAFVVRGTYGEWKGEITEWGGRTRGPVRTYSMKSDADAFRTYMRSQWLAAGLWTGAALILWPIMRKLD